MEKVLIWPSQYPLLLKGLAEQNGAFILDALEAWPHCQTEVDAQGVESTILPPIYYLIWLKPLEPFDACYFQHIDEYEETQISYTDMLLAHFSQSGIDKQSIVLMLIKRLSQYSQLQPQIECLDTPDFFLLTIEQEMYEVVLWILEQGTKLTNHQLVTCWQDKRLKETLITRLPECVKNVETLSQFILNNMQLDMPMFDLLSYVLDKDKVQVLIERAFLNLIKSKQVKQAELLDYIKQGAVGGLIDEHGKNAFMYAIEKGFVSVVEQLLAHQQLDQNDNSGNTLMHLAVLSNSSAVISLLFAQGCKTKVVNNLGETPYMLAYKHGAFIAKKSLEQHGVKELSESEKYSKIKLVHCLVAFVCFAFPLQISLFFSDTFDYKTEIVWFFTLMSVVLVFISKRIKGGPLYPVNHHPWSLRLLYGKAFVSACLQTILALLVLVTLTTS